ncbi:MAG: sodium:solute symporter family protein [Fimbriimonadaceae bacterium]|nr:sodium:solute symporter family protein [Fimbriimonadaceae bacterium]
MAETHLSAGDLALVVVYLLALLAAGVSFRRRGQGDEAYFLAGRTLTLPAFVATLVATWYGGILGIGEFSHQSGLSAWFIFGLPYYAFALVFALWLAPRIRASELYTIPDKLAEAYGRPAALLGALYCWLLTNPAAYVLMTSVLLQLIFGLPPLPAMLLGVALSTVYVYTGGFRADVRVNVVQFVLMFAGFALVLPYCFTRLGDLGWLRTTLLTQGAAQHLTWHGGNTTQYIVVWFFIALWTLVDPGFHQRCYAAQDGRTAQRGVLVSILCWFVFDAMTNLAGLYASAALPSIDPKMAYPLLAEQVLPPLVKGLFYVGLLATVMSTVVSYTFLCGVTFSRDIVWRFTGWQGEHGAQRWTAVGLLLTTVIAVSMAWLLPTVVGLWYAIGTVFVPGLLLPLLTAYAPRWRIPARAVVVAMLGSSGASLAWLLYGQQHLVDGFPSYPLGLEPLYPGLAVSLLVFGAGWLGVRRQPLQRGVG